MIRLTIDRDAPDPAMLRQAAVVLARGGIVAVPTDTLYALAVDPRNARAVDALFDAKRRPAERAIPVMAADEDQVARQVGVVSPLARRLAQRFWPGPLTLIIEASSQLAGRVHGDSGRVAVRVPNHLVARSLAKIADHPLTATSANLSGDAPLVDADEVARAFGSVVDVVIDSGPLAGGLPSTIVETSGSTPVLIRAGAVPWERVLKFVEAADRATHDRPDA